MQWWANAGKLEMNKDIPSEANLESSYAFDEPTGI